MRYTVHFTFTFIFLVCIVIFKIINQRAIIDLLLDIAGYTYGPLLGLFAFGILTKRNIHDRLVPLVCIVAPLISFGLNTLSDQKMLWGNYQIGLELLLINGLLTFSGLLLISKKQERLTIEV